MRSQTIFFIIIGILVFLILFRRKEKDPFEEIDSYDRTWDNPLENWSIMNCFKEITILSKYAGEIRFGPTYIHIRSEPDNAFGKEIYGDWFYRTKDGIYLQRWDLNAGKKRTPKDANTDLVFYNRIENTIEVVQIGINTFFWEMEKNEDGLTLISNNGKTKKRIKISHE